LIVYIIPSSINFYCCS